MAMTANEQLQDLQINSQHLVEEYKNEISSTLLLFFKRMESLVNREIKIHYDEDNVLQKDKTSLKRSLLEIQDRELNKIHKRLLTDTEKFLGVYAKGYEKQLKDVLKDLTEFISVKSVDEKTLKKSFEKAKVDLEKGESYTLNGLWTTFLLSVRNGLTRNVESAYSLDKSTRDFTSDVNDKYKINRGQLNAIILTMIQQAVGIATKSVNKVNSDFIRGYMWDAILDTRTSPFCIDHNGRYWVYNYPERSTLEAEIYPPGHFRCRSSATPIIKSYRELGILASDLTPDQKALIPNSSVSTQSYMDWLTRQPPSIQKEVLGPVRFKAYQEGNLDVTAFYTNNGRKLTLKELEKQNIKLSEEYLKR